MVGKRLARKNARKAAVVRLNGGSKESAVLAAGYSETTARAKPDILDSKPVFQEELINVKAKMEAAALGNNITFERLAKKIDTGLDAHKVVRIYETGKTEDIPDHDAQIKWFDRGAMWLGVRKEDSESNAGSTVNINKLLVIIQQAEKERGLTA